MSGASDHNPSETSVQDPPFQYAGGQDCPQCSETVGIVDRYCRWCGQPLRVDHPDRAIHSEREARDTAAACRLTARHSAHLSAVDPGVLDCIAGRLEARWDL